MAWILLCFIGLGFYIKEQKEALEQRIEELENRFNSETTDDSIE